VVNLIREFSYIRLQEEIEFTRENMIFVGMEYGLTHPLTIFLSGKLDQLLNHLSIYESSFTHENYIQECFVHT
jgi:hypothetical protein